MIPWNQSLGEDLIKISSEQDLKEFCRRTNQINITANAEEFISDSHKVSDFEKKQRTLRMRQKMFDVANKLRFGAVPAPDRFHICRLDFDKFKVRRRNNADIVRKSAK
ncbi:MAG: hypothetical protein LBJ18_03615 [Rickettsiales bacterium]|jgi:hypothetical protein|nr:hypothetical protein [Rickettsiales bacterium]